MRNINVDIAWGESELTFATRYSSHDGFLEIEEATLIDVDGRTPTEEEKKQFSSVPNKRDFYDALVEAHSQKHPVPTCYEDSINWDSRI